MTACWFSSSWTNDCLQSEISWWILVEKIVHRMHLMNIDDDVTGDLMTFDQLLYWQTVQMKFTWKHLMVLWRSDWAPCCATCISEPLWGQWRRQTLSQGVNPHQKSHKNIGTNTAAMQVRSGSVRVSYHWSREFEKLFQLVTVVWRDDACHAPRTRAAASAGAADRRSSFTRRGIFLHPLRVFAHWLHTGLVHSWAASELLSDTPGGQCGAASPCAVTVWG